MSTSQHPHDKKVSKFEEESRLLKQILHHFDSITEIIHHNPDLRSSYRLRSVLQVIRTRISQEEQFAPCRRFADFTDVE